MRAVRACGVCMRCMHAVCALGAYMRYVHAVRACGACMRCVHAVRACGVCSTCTQSANSLTVFHDVARQRSLDDRLQRFDPSQAIVVEQLACGGAHHVTELRGRLPVASMVRV